MSTMDLKFVSSRWKFTRPAIVVVLVVIVGVLWISSSRHSAAKPVDKAGVVAPTELAPADIATVETRSLSKALPLSGSLSPLIQTTLKSKVSGEVLDMTVYEGQKVQRGEVLARIDVRLASATRDSQQAGLEKSRADLALAKLNRDNSQKLLDEKFISQNAYDSANSTYEASLATEKLSVAQLRLAQIAMEDAVIRAPFDGVVSARLVQPGGIVQPDSQILSVVDLRHMEFEASAPASEIPGVHVGQIAHFHVDGFGGREFEGRVERINPVTDAGSRSITVYLAVDNLDGALRGGMFAQGTLTLDKTGSAPAVPTAAIRSEAGLPYVLLIENKTVLRRSVTPGLSSPDEGWTEVTDGLKPGEQVIVANLAALKSGDAVTIKAAPDGEGVPAVKTGS